MHAEGMPNYGKAQILATGGKVASGAPTSYVREFINYSSTLETTALFISHWRRALALRHDAGRLGGVIRPMGSSTDFNASQGRVGA